jgi:hypothetical protein
MQQARYKDFAEGKKNLAAAGQPFAAAHIPTKLRE